MVDSRTTESTPRTDTEWKVRAERAEAQVARAKSLAASWEAMAEDDPHDPCNAAGWAADLLEALVIPPTERASVAEQKSVIDRIEDVLAAHTLDLTAVIRDRSVKVGYTLGCACGYRWEPDPQIDHHRRHVAGALAERRATSPGKL